MPRKITRRDPRLAPTPPHLARIITRELELRGDETLTAHARRAVFTRATFKSRPHRPDKPRPLFEKPLYEPPDVELILRAERWQRVWAFLAGEDVQPMRDYTPAESKFEFSVSWAVGIPPVREVRWGTRPPSEMDVVLGEFSRVAIGIGRVGLDYRTWKRKFYRHIDRAITRMEAQAAERIEKVGKIQLLDQAEILAAFLMHERLVGQQRSTLFPVIARALWPSAYEQRDRFKREYRDTRREDSLAKLDAARRQIAALERRAKRRVQSARALINGGWRSFFVPVPAPVIEDEEENQTEE